MICAKPLKGGEVLEEIPRLRGAATPLGHHGLGGMAHRRPDQRVSRAVGGGVCLCRLHVVLHGCGYNDD